jgi:hypothetical protein
MPTWFNPQTILCAADLTHLAVDRSILPAFQFSIIPSFHSRPELATLLYMSNRV